MVGYEATWHLCLRSIDEIHCSWGKNGVGWGGVNLLSQEYAEPTTVGLDQGDRELKKLHPQDPDM